MSTGKEFKNQLALMGMQSLGGLKAVVDILDNERTAGRLDRFRYKRSRDMVRSLAENKVFIKPNDRITELDEKVRQAVEINSN